MDPLVLNAVGSILVTFLLLLIGYYMEWSVMVKEYVHIFPYNC